MEVTFVELPKLTVIGFKKKICPEKADEMIIPMWEQLRNCNSELEKNSQLLCLGVNQMPPNANYFYYMVGYGSEKNIETPPGFDRWEIPAHKYAKFVHEGDVQFMYKTFQKIFNEWLMEGDYEEDGNIELELYNEDFNLEEPEKSKCYILVPIKEKKDKK